MDTAEALDTLERAEDLVEMGRPADALEEVRTLYGHAFGSYERGRALALECCCLDHLDLREEAQNLVAEIMKEEGDDPAFVLAAGMAFSDLNSFVQAELFLRNLCELEPENHVAWFNLAITLGREGRYPESIEMYDQCIEHNPSFPDAHLQKAYCYELMDDFVRAAQTYRIYLDIQPDDGEAWNALGAAESEGGNHDGAYQAFRQAVASGYDPADVYFNWAISAAAKDDRGQLERCLGELQSLDPEGWRTYLTQADFEEAEGNAWIAWESVGEAFEAALEEEDDPEAAGYVASALLRLAARNDMTSEVAEYVERIFEQELFDQEVLEALLDLEGRFSNASMSHQVVLKAPENRPRFPDIDAYVVYGVAADSAEECGALAIEFELKVSGVEWELFSVQRMTSPDEGPVGVYWRSEEMPRPPGGNISQKEASSE